MAPPKKDTGAKKAPWARDSAGPGKPIAPPPTLEQMEALAREHRWNPERNTLQEFCTDEVVRILFQAVRVMDMQVKTAKIRHRLKGFMAHAEHWNSVREYGSSVLPIGTYYYWAVTDPSGFANNARDYVQVKSGAGDW